MRWNSNITEYRDPNTIRGHLLAHSLASIYILVQLPNADKIMCISRPTYLKVPVRKRKRHSPVNVYSAFAC